MVSDFLRKEINQALVELYPEASAGGFSVVPERRFGDYTTNVAMILAATTGKKPQEIADSIAEYFEGKPDMGKTVLNIEIAGPGFINFFLTDEALSLELDELKNKIEKGYDFLSGKKVNLEFISANPTGELHIGHGRNAFFGDALAKILSFSGAKVYREFYINNSRESTQVKALGVTALGYGNVYRTKILDEQIKRLAGHFKVAKYAGYELSKIIQKDNHKFIEEKLGIKFDGWYSEEEKLQSSGFNKKTLAELAGKGLTYEKDGAVWLKTSEYGDDEDRVLVRTGGMFTYFLSDIAYHADKFGRGYDEVVNIWGADHHGHVKRMTAVKKMLGWTGELKIFITQMVSLKEKGESAKMSKRAGNVVLLTDLIDELGMDVVRWFFSEKSLNTHMDFDMALAKEHSAKNPVFYAQYAHARICSIIEKANNIQSDGSSMGSALKEKTGRSLAVKLSEFPEIISGISQDCQVHKITTYAYELAHSFSQFYENMRIVGETTHNAGALALAALAKDTLAKSLGLLGVSTPNKM